MVLCGTKNDFSMELLKEPFEVPLFLRVLAVQRMDIYCQKPWSFDNPLNETWFFMIAPLVI